MKIITWNINSIRARTDKLLDWLKVAQPDVLCLQELKCTDDQFPMLAGLRDASLGGVLRALHSDVSHAWTVAELAKRAGMSRSAFAMRFTSTVGCAPMEYLSRWRMSLARNALSRGGKSLDRLAEEIGYESASAFSTAFRRRFGCAPGTFARKAASLSNPEVPARV